MHNREFIEYSGDEASSVFSIPFEFMGSSDVRAKIKEEYHAERQLAPGVEYTIAGNELVLLGKPIDDSATVTIYRTRELPILLNDDMVRATLRNVNPKTQTRRLIPERLLERWYDYDDYVSSVAPPGSLRYSEKSFFMTYAPWAVGDRLWVRETFAEGVIGCEEQAGYSYRADHWDKKHGDGPNKLHWIPSIHMPRRASRITLEITGVRVERVQDITEEDALEEGAWYIEMPDSPGYSSHTNGFAILWDSINAKRGFGWDDNPWVWVIEFRRIENA